jgi:Transglutaminase-like superfamily
MRKRLLSKAVLALDLVLWLFGLPLILRIHSIPTLLKRLAPGEKHKNKTPIELKDTVGIVTRICNLRVFRPPFFPKLCLRQSLSLYRTLSRMGYPVQIHFGVINDENGFQGHSWVTLEGKAVADTARNEIFKTVYSYSSDRSISAGFRI